MVGKGDSLVRTVGKVILRLLALCNLLFAVVGIVDMETVFRALPILQKKALTVRSPVSWIDNPFPLLDAEFYTSSCINITFIIFLILSSFFIWRLAGRGRQILNLLFGTELC